MTTNTKSIADRLKEARCNLGMTTKELAAANGVTETRVLAWEDGSERFPLEYIECVANALNVKPVWLWFGDVEDPEDHNGFYKTLFVNERGLYVQHALEWYAESVLKEAFPENLDGEVKMAVKILLKAFRYTSYRVGEENMLLPIYKPLQFIALLDVAWLSVRYNDENGTNVWTREFTIEQLYYALTNEELGGYFWQLVQAIPRKLLKRAFCMIRLMIEDGGNVSKCEPKIRAIDELMNGKKKENSLQEEPYGIIQNTTDFTQLEFLWSFDEGDYISTLRKRILQSVKNRQRGRDMDYVR